MIHFIRPSSCYSQILDSHIDPILKHLDATVSEHYEKGKTNVSLFVEYDPSEVFMSHGIADKNWRNERRVDKFHYICVSGPFWYGKYPNIDRSRILTIGYPKLDPIFQGEYTRTPGGKRVLFAPTHRAIPEVSLDGRLKLDFDYITSTHPACRSDKSPTMQALVDADVVISDCGSLVYEAWSLGKPVVFCDWLVKDAIIKTFPGSLEAAIYQYGIGLHAKSYGEMVAMLDGDIDDRVGKLMEQVFPSELRGHSGEAAAKVLLELASLSSV